MSARNPQEDGVCCDLCGHEQFDEKHHWPVGDFWNPSSVPISVWECANCQLVTLHPVPTAEELPDEGDWWSPRRKDFRRRRWFKERWEKVRLAMFGDPRDRIVWATRRAMPQGRLLDVGCGKGELMVPASKTYECVGLEPSPIAADYVRELGFEVIQATFEDAEVEPGSFDVVTLDSVIEHVRSPVAVLKKINRILAPGGVVVMKTPKFGGLSYRRHGSAWNGFRHGYHTFLFTGDSLGGCMEAAGFEVLRRPKRDRMLDDILLLWGKKVAEVSSLPDAPARAA
jgi:SAM-dependent methyltransferase